MVAQTRVSRDTSPDKSAPKSRLGAQARSLLGLKKNTGGNSDVDVEMRGTASTPLSP